MKIAVVGTGYVGLVSGTCFSETGNYVTCVDIDKEKVDKLSSGKITIYEPGLENLFKRNLEAGRLKFTTDLASAIKDAKVIFLALPTPPGADGSADLKYILGVAEDLGKLLTEYKVIVDKSTVPVGTAEKVSAKIKQNYAGEFSVISNPEFLREGVAVEDFMKPDRIVIGTDSQKARDIISELYEPYVRQGNPIVFMDERSAEMTKYAANSFLATKITFMNEVANLCEKVGANVDDVRKGISLDERIGKRFLFPGIGYGGSCFPKDVQALVKTAADNDYDFQILNSVETVNKLQKKVLFNKIKAHYSSLKGMKFGMWGLAFKPNTDDIREAPALEIIKNLLSEGASVKAFDPEGMENVAKLLGNTITFTKTMYEALEGIDALIICTEWPQFRTPEFELLKEKLNKKVIFDGRNVYKLEKMQDLGLSYISIGRKNINC